MFGISPVEVTVDIFVLNDGWEKEETRTFNRTLESTEFWIYMSTASPNPCTR